MSEENSEHLLWEQTGEKIVYNSRILRLREVSRRSLQRAEASFLCIDTSDWVTIIPEIQKDGKSEPSFLIVRQFRHGTGRISMEFPAGTIDSGENPIQTARRELLEETGYTAENFTQVGAVSPNPAIMTNTTYTYLARNLKLTAEQSLDENELLDFHIVEFEDIKRAIGVPPYDSAIMVQAWHMYLKNRNPA